MGGGAMRAAAKVAGITVANGGLRGITSENHPVFSATRMVASSRYAAGKAAEDVKLAASHSPQAGVQIPSSEIEDWVFAGGDEEAILSDRDKMPTVVFGVAPPTRREAKESTSELTVALEKAYLLSPDNLVGCEGSHVEDHDSGLQFINKKACVSSDTVVPPAVPAHAIKAFRFLHESSVAQNVVASIACDPNVWNAVLHNQELQAFLQSQRTGMTCVNEDQSSSENIDVASDYAESHPESGFMDIVENVKINVIDMMSSLSDYFRNIFEPQVEANKVFTSSHGTVTADTVMEASFMGLAVMAILVILLKRV